MTDSGSTGGKPAAPASAPAAPATPAATPAATPVPASTAPTTSSPATPPVPAATTTNPPKPKDAIIIVRFGDELGYADQRLLKSDLEKLFSPFGVRKVVTTGKNYALVTLPENKVDQAFKMVDHKSNILVGNNAAITLHRQKTKEGSKHENSEHGGDKHGEDHGGGKKLPKPAINAQLYPNAKRIFYVEIKASKETDVLISPDEELDESLLPHLSLRTDKDGFLDVLIRIKDANAPKVSVRFTFPELGYSEIRIFNQIF